MADQKLNKDKDNKDAEHAEPVQLDKEQQEQQGGKQGQQQGGKQHQGAESR